MTGPGTLFLSDRGGGNPVIIDHGDARLSWVISGPGDYSCTLTAADARRFGIDANLSLGSKWVRYEHPDLPAWGGVVTSASDRPGAMALNAQSFHALFRKRRVPRTYGQQSATAGALARRAFSDVQADDATLIADFQADETGEPIEYQWRGGDLADDVFRELGTASGQEWTIDADRVAQWRRKLGRDRSGQVCLHHPIEIVDYERTVDIWSATNDIEGIASDDTFADAAYDQADDDGSVKRYGRLMASIRYPNVVSKGTVRAKILRDLRKLRFPAQVIRLTTANVGHCWSRYELGDEIMIVLPDANVIRTARIEARSIEVDAKLETLGMVIT